MIGLQGFQRAGRPWSSTEEKVYSPAEAGTVVVGTGVVGTGVGAGVGTGAAATTRRTARETAARRPRVAGARSRSDRVAGAGDDTTTETAPWVRVRSRVTVVHRLPVRRCSWTGRPDVPGRTRALSRTLRPTPTVAGTDPVRTTRVADRRW